MLMLFTLGLLLLLGSHAASIPAPPHALTYNDVRGQPYNVSYDSRSFIIDGRRTLLLGGAVHYPRIEPQRWHSVLQQMLDAGMNHVQIYTFWNLHEPTFDGLSHAYDFHSPRSNLRNFLRAAQDVGLFVNVRVGPYVCAEWNLGGLPLWLTRVPGIRFRAINDQWQSAVSTFVTRVLQEVEPFLAKNGGPVILGQIENELGSYGGAASQECVASFPLGVPQ
jgi:beta-galactosidase